PLRLDPFVQPGTPDPAAPIAAAGTAALNPNAPTPIPLPDEPRLGGVVIIQEEPPTPPSATGTAAFLDAAPATEGDAATAAATTAAPAVETATGDDAAPATAAATTTEEVDHASVEATGSFLADLPTLDSPDVARQVPGPTIQILTEDLPATLEAAETGLAAAADQIAAAGEELRAAVDPTLAAYSGTVTNTNTPPIVAGGFSDDLPDFNSPIPTDIGQPAPAPTTTPDAPATLAEPVSAVPAERAAALTPAATSAMDIAAPTPDDYELPAFDPTPGLATGAAGGTPIPPPARDPNARRPVQAVSLITIGVRDMAASIRFYEALGWQRAARGKYDQTAFFQLQGQILALYPMQDQLREQNMAGAIPAPGGITLALHVSDKADVWSVYQRFIDAGGTSLRPPAEMASGAVSSYVADPDGNPWEISWVPQFRIDAEGGLWLP
ncbi:MAG: VOC family protein, partial [Planctomycetes bacterium]|nr:VOC family protein [Planctomycetota bacterium]